MLLALSAASVPLCVLCVKSFSSYLSSDFSFTQPRVAMPFPLRQAIARHQGRIMKKSLLLLILSLFIAATTVRTQSPAASPERVTVIRAGTLIDGSNGAPRKD